MPPRKGRRKTSARFQYIASALSVSKEGLMAVTTLDAFAKAVQRATGSSPTYSRGIARKLAANLNGAAKAKRKGVVIAGAEEK